MTEESQFGYDDMGAPLDVANAFVNYHGLSNKSSRSAAKDVTNAA